MDAFANINNPVDFFTLGMFIIDEIDYVHSKGDNTAIIGGAGTYAALGARLVAGDQYAAAVGFIVDVGSDFPRDFRTILESWNTRCLFREDQTRLTTRAWNGLDGEVRAFKYLTPKLRLEAWQLPMSHLFSHVFHLVCSGARLQEQVKAILDRRETVAAEASIQCPPRPKFVWEPIPDLCTPAELDDFWDACSLVDVVSPNEVELSAYFAAQKMTDRIDNSSRPTITEEVMRGGVGPHGKGILVVRTGSTGCTVFTTNGSLRMRPYFLLGEVASHGSRVVDPTGGGNTFLGALSKALIGQCVPSRNDALDLIREASSVDTTRQRYKIAEEVVVSLVFANVAASFAIEQKGMPSVSYAEGKTVWNKETFEGRVKEYIEREREHIMEQVIL